MVSYRKEVISNIGILHIVVASIRMFGAFACGKLCAVALGLTPGFV
jgi:hypothetical protein